MCGAWVKMRKCSSASIGSGTDRKRLSRAVSSAELRNPNSGAAVGPFADTADWDIPLRLGKRRMKMRTAAKVSFIGLRLLRLSCDVFLAASWLPQPVECLLEIWKLVHGINPGELDLARFVDHTDGPLTGSCERIRFPEHTVLAA